MTKVLLVDDEELVRKVVRVVLEAEGHEVAEAADGEGALSGMRSEKPDVIVLDLMMPGEDGVEVCRKIKSERPEVRVLVLTSLPEPEARDEATEAGADDFMLKPFSSLDLLERISTLTKS